MHPQQNQQEKALIAAFNLMTKGERSFLLETAQAVTEGRQIRNPNLRIAENSAALTAGALGRSLS